jgi:hypothetical protein
MVHICPPNYFPINLLFTILLHKFYLSFLFTFFNYWHYVLLKQFNSKINTYLIYLNPLLFISYVISYAMHVSWVMVSTLLFFWYAKSYSIPIMLIMLYPLMFFMLYPLIYHNTLPTTYYCARPFVVRTICCQIIIQ